MYIIYGESIIILLIAYYLYNRDTTIKFYVKNVSEQLINLYDDSLNIDHWFMQVLECLQQAMSDHTRLDAEELKRILLNPNAMVSTL